MNEPDGEFIGHLPRFTSEEQELRWILNELHKDYQRKITPIVKRLSKIDAAKPLPPVNSGDADELNMEQVRRLLDRMKRKRK